MRKLRGKSKNYHLGSVAGKSSLPETLKLTGIFLGAEFPGRAVAHVGPKNEKRTLGIQNYKYTPPIGNKCPNYKSGQRPCTDYTGSVPESQ